MDQHTRNLPLSSRASCHRLFVMAREYGHIYMCVFCIFRHDSDSDTVSTDDDQTWGSLGVFEYSQKGLPHALVHAPEQAIFGGHFGAYDTKVVEADHRTTLKTASSKARVYASRNLTQDEMLLWNLRTRLWNAVISLNSPEPQRADDPPNEMRQLLCPLNDISDAWLRSVPTMEASAAVRYNWSTKLLSKRMLIARGELLFMLSSKLRLTTNSETMKKLSSKLTFEFFGTLKMSSGRGENPRKFVGVSDLSPSRRDFVRLMGRDPLTNISLSAQVCVDFATHVWNMSHMCDLLS